MEINEYLIKFFQAIRKIESVQLFPQKAKLSDTEFRMLREVVLESEQHRGIISSELARRLGVTRSAVSQIVTKLEKQGIVRRVAAEDDRKIAYVQLSEYSMRIFEEQCVKANEIIGRVVDEFSEIRMDALVDSCNDLYNVFLQVNKDIEEGKPRRYRPVHEEVSAAEAPAEEPHQEAEPIPQEETEELAPAVEETLPAKKKRGRKKKAQG